jgi:hypothetical protein
MGHPSLPVPSDQRLARVLHNPSRAKGDNNPAADRGSQNAKRFRRFELRIVGSLYMV